MTTAVGAGLEDYQRRAMEQPVTEPRDSNFLLRTIDAEVWTKEWLEIISQHPEIPTDKGTMLCWFANAIMTGFDEGQRRAQAESSLAVAAEREACATLMDELEAYYIKDEGAAELHGIEGRVEKACSAGNAIRARNDAAQVREGAEDMIVYKARTVPFVPSDWFEHPTPFELQEAEPTVCNVGAQIDANTPSQHDPSKPWPECCGYVIKDLVSAESMLSTYPNTKPSTAASESSEGTLHCTVVSPALPHLRSVIGTETMDLPITKHDND